MSEKIKLRHYQPELQLLIIDLGTSCVVKVEKGSLDADVVSMSLPEEIRGLLGYNIEPLKMGYCMVSDKTSEEIQERLDTHIHKDKPVPRIERDPECDNEVFDVFGKDHHAVIGLRTYEALSQLVGKPLPIYEPKSSGTWVPIVSRIQADGSLTKDLGFSAWRYTR